MRILCILGFHGWEDASGGEYINLGYCRRCEKPNNNLAHQLISIERLLWAAVAGSEWGPDEQSAVVLRDLMQYAGYENEVLAFYRDTQGYQFIKGKPSKRAEEAARRLADKHPLAVATN